MQRASAQGDSVPVVNEDVVEPHVESMNYFLTEGMHAVVAGLKPVEVSRRRPPHARPASASAALRPHLPSQHPPPPPRQRTHLHTRAAAADPAPGHEGGVPLLVLRPTRCPARQGGRQLQRGQPPVPLGVQRSGARAGGAHQRRGGQHASWSSCVQAWWLPLVRCTAQQQPCTTTCCAALRAGHDVQGRVQHHHQLGAR